MLRSMTGYGRAHSVVKGYDVLVEMRSVNHRYYEFNSRIPRTYSFLEEKLKTMVQGKISRGKIEVALTINHIDGKDTLITVNNKIAQEYVDALREANKLLRLTDDVTLSHVAKMPDVFCVQKNEEDESEVWECVAQVASEALEKFVYMREIEGERLKIDVISKINLINDMVQKIDVLAPQFVEAYKDRLYNKLCDVLKTTGIDQQRILTEAAIFSDRVSVDEELVRLKSHIAQVESLLDSDEPVGRKIDFIIQEMNREVNTTGSKAQNIEITRLVVNMKSEIEKIREQIQNLE